MDLPTLNKRRGTIKTKLIVFKNFILSQIAANPDQNKKLDDKLIEDIELRLDRAKQILDQYDEIQAARFVL